MNAASPLVVHHLEHSRSLRVLWLLEELGLPYEMKRYARDASFRAPPELSAVHPLGRSPVVEVDGHVLAESGAIIEYLVEREGGKLRPQELEARLRYRFFLHYAEGSAMPPLLVQLLVEKIRGQRCRSSSSQSRVKSRPASSRATRGRRSPLTLASWRAS
jgi:glutathione S-transferase